MFVDDWYRSARLEILGEVSKLELEQLGGTNLSDWQAYFMRKWALNEIVFKPGSPTISQRVDRTQETDRHGHPRFSERDVARLAIEIEPNEDIDKLINMTGTTWSVNPWGEWLFRNGQIEIETRPITDSLQSAKKIIEGNAASLNEGIKRGNKDLLEFIKTQVEGRMKTVQARQESFNSLAEATGFKLEVKANTATPKSVAPRIKESIAALRRPTPTQTEIPRLKPEELQTILDVIDAHAITYERTPYSANKLGETDIRNLLLATLNGVFNLGAVGEAFSNRGKTDIYMVVPQGGLFIAECKIWSGIKAVNEAVDQILGYLTWRDSYGIVLIFSRNKDFSEVQKSLPEGIAATKSLKGKAHKIDNHHFKSNNSLPGDAFKTVEIHYLIYNLFVEQA